jgi:small subunit ribosomal protein S6
MRDYETVFILDPALDENQVKEEVDKVRNLITGLGGEVGSAEPPIRKRLAYEIKGRTEGYYMLITFKLDPASVKEMERAYRLNEKVLRHIVVASQRKVVVSEGPKATEEPKATTE